MSHLKTRQAGVTLTELMVSIVIGIILMLGAVALLVSSKQTYVIQDDLARIQEGGRLAMDMIQNDMRQAGYGGCSDDFTAVSVQAGLAANATGLYDFTQQVEGFDNFAGAGAWAPSGQVITTSIVGNPPNAGTDGLTIRHIGGPTSPLTAPMLLPADPVPAAGNAIGLAANSLAAVSDCATADVFRATAVGGTVGHGGIGKAYPDTAQLSAATAVRYYVANDANGNPALFRMIDVAGAPTAQLLVDGVENMQLRFGVDTGGDGRPDTFVPAAAGLAWNNIKAVRISLLIRSTDEVASDVDVNGYDLDGDDVDDFVGPGDRRRRRVMTTTVFMRNDSI